MLVFSWPPKAPQHTHARCNFLPRLEGRLSKGQHGAAFTTGLDVSCCECCSPSLPSLPFFFLQGAFSSELRAGATTHTRVHGARPPSPSHSHSHPRLPMRRNLWTFSPGSAQRRSHPPSSRPVTAGRPFPHLSPLLYTLPPSPRPPPLSIRRNPWTFSPGYAQRPSRPRFYLPVTADRRPKSFSPRWRSSSRTI
jgi:hypothetical protein